MVSVVFIGEDHIYVDNTQKANVSGQQQCQDAAIPSSPPIKSKTLQYEL